MMRKDRLHPFVCFAPIKHTVRRFGVGIGLYAMSLCVGVVTLPAQSVLTPEITTNGSRPPGWHTNAGEARANLGYEESRTNFRAAPSTSSHYPKDSIKAVVERRAQTWVATLRSAPVQGLQLDPAEFIAVVAGQESLAQQQIATRLATPGLSLQDRAYTLAAAIQSFADADVPARLPVAERYLVQLDALGKPAAYWQKVARLALLKAYFELGRSDDVIRVGVRAMELAGDVSFDWEASMGFTQPNQEYYLKLILALSGRTDGRERIRAMNKGLLASAIAPPALIARDSAHWAWQQWFATALAKSLVNASERIGRPGTPLVANYWVNRGPTRDSQTVAVNDGKIHVIEFGGLGCDGCVDGMLMLERLHQRYPAVTFTTLSQGWVTRGNRVVGAKAIADDMADHIINRLHITYPYGIVMPTKTRATDDDGEVLVSDIKWLDDVTYPYVSKPTIYLLDSRGLIRFGCIGVDRETEKTLARVIEFLQKETLTRDAVSRGVSGVSDTSPAESRADVVSSGSGR